MAGGVRPNLLKRVRKEKFSLDRAGSNHLKRMISEYVASIYIERVVKPYLKSQYDVLLGGYHSFQLAAVWVKSRRDVLHELLHEIAFRVPLFLLGEELEVREDPSSKKPMLRAVGKRCTMGLSYSYMRTLGCWPPEGEIYMLENKNNKILVESANIFKLGYRPDFFFLGFVKNGIEEVEVKIEERRDKLSVVKLIPKDGFIFEVKTSDPTKKIAYTKNQLNALTRLRNIHFYVLHVPLSLSNTFPLEMYSPNIPLDQLNENKAL